MEELYAKFLPQFLELARERMKRAYETIERPDHAALVVTVRDLHGIAGEAGLLGLSQIVPLARNGEELAKKLRDNAPGADLGDLIAALEELTRALDVVAQPKTTK